MSSFFPAYAFLLGAVACEILGTTFLVKSEQFTKLVPSIVVVLGYIASFYFLSFALKTIPVGVAYAIWGGLGIAVTAIIGVVVFHNKIDLAAVLGIAMIIGGVLLINLCSKISGH